MSRRDVRALDATLHSVAHAVLAKSSRSAGLERLAQYLATLPAPDLRKMSHDHAHVAEVASAYLRQHGPANWGLELREEPKPRRDNLAEAQHAIRALT